MSTQRRFRVIAAVEDAKMGIGLSGKLPWSIPAEMRYFRQVTTSTADPFRTNAVIVGRATWETSLGAKPLPQRATFVLSRDAARGERIASAGCVWCRSLDDAIASVSARSDVETAFVIGGAELYAEALRSPLCEAILLTRVHGSYDADAFFPAIDPSVYRVSQRSPVIAEADGSTAFHVDGYVRTDSLPVSRELPWFAGEHEEYQYLRLVADVIGSGSSKESRAGPTLSKFGAMFKFDLRDGTLPLLTTKRVFWRGVAEELLWFISGDTSAVTLQKKNIHIWDANSTPEFMKKACPTCSYEAGDLGPVYGFQWRHFGAEYHGMGADHSGKGVDQLRSVIDTIRNNPDSRRIIMSAWNPVDLHKMALPPCHILSHFMVHDGGLSCLLYQRSADLGLGVPFNIASYSLLTCMIAHVTGLVPRELVHVIGDAHVYKNHVEPLKEQLCRTPRPFPKLEIKRKVELIDDFRFEDFEVTGYDPHPTIKMEMNA